MASRDSTIRMRKEITLLHASSVMTGSIIGSGIFVSPISITKNCGSVAVSLIMWVVSGMLTLLVALCYNELGGIFPKSGGEYNFFREVLGPLSAFVDVWHQFVIVQPTFQALLALTTTDYLVQAIFPDNCDVPEVAKRLLAVWILVTVVVVNSVYVRYVTRVQTVLTAIKVLALVGIIIIGIVQLIHGKFEFLEMGFENTNPDIGGHAVAVQSGIFTYMGWEYLFCLLDEVKQPERTVPKATVISLVAITVIYTMTNVAYFTVLSPEDIMSSKAVAFTFAQKTLGKVSLVVPFLVACATVGSLNGAIFGGSRYYFAAARDDLFPSVMSTIHHKYLTPWPSLFSVTAIAVLYIVTGEAVALVEYLGFVATAILFIVTVCLLYLRWKKPEMTRPIKIPIFIPITCCIVLGSLLCLGVYQTPTRNGVACLLVATGVPVYYLIVKWASTRKPWRSLVYKYTCISQKVMMAVPTDKETD